MLYISVQVAQADAILAILISVLGRQNDTVLRNLLDSQDDPILEVSQFDL